MDISRQNDNEVKMPYRVNSKDIRPIEAHVSTDYGGKDM